MLIRPTPQHIHNSQKPALLALITPFIVPRLNTSHQPTHRASSPFPTYWAPHPHSPPPQASAPPCHPSYPPSPHTIPPAFTPIPKRKLRLKTRTLAEASGQPLRNPAEASPSPHPPHTHSHRQPKHAPSTPPPNRQPQNRLSRPCISRQYLLCLPTHLERTV